AGIGAVTKGRLNSNRDGRAGAGGYGLQHLHRGREEGSAIQRAGDRRAQTSGSATRHAGGADAAVAKNGGHGPAGGRRGERFLRSAVRAAQPLRPARKTFAGLRYRPVLARTDPGGERTSSAAD